jgi:hypothetical protein
MAWIRPLSLPRRSSRRQIQNPCNPILAAYFDVSEDRAPRRHLLLRLLRHCLLLLLLLPLLLLLLLLLLLRCVGFMELSTILRRCCTPKYLGGPFSYPKLAILLLWNATHDPPLIEFTLYYYLDLRHVCCCCCCCCWRCCNW